MTTKPPPGPTHTPMGFGIDPRLGAAALGAPAASKEDSLSQAIIEFQPCNCFDYRVRYEPQLQAFFPDSNKGTVCLFDVMILSDQDYGSIL